ncbi:hypothetical protein Ppa06_28080 [Planomonospora parontospora subsp. parontospora]|uniref:Uncharacterized protein n=2 Tax=Planomonospora parontospora TaxID=58119 RepID=A0AA37F4P1_9ACTN|nr:hypothetical protein GCM10010126_30080 [Planomonospora parontospora]GII09010.1 hypothetical protein Ppa06_28080 [Planomonospora parontospora subsp. parontospora]
MAWHLEGASPEGETGHADWCRGHVRGPDDAAALPEPPAVVIGGRTLRNLGRPRLPGVLGTLGGPAETVAGRVACYGFTYKKILTCEGSP